MRPDCSSDTACLASVSVCRTSENTIHQELEWSARSFTCCELRVTAGREGGSERSWSCIRDRSGEMTSVMNGTAR
jgi:hypothetical protein